MENFRELGLPEPLLHRLEQMEFTKPTPVQAQAIPAALAGKDILGSAQTGTGKTGAYGIPLVAELLTNDRCNGLILLPTRELAMQVMTELKKFIGSSKIKTALLIGGEQMPKQINQLRARPRLIVGTPGRINDHLERGTLMLHQTNYLILDEVDRMLDMGFGVQLDAMSRFLTAKRQTLMFSATLPTNIEKLSAKYLTDPARISVGSTRKPAANVTQTQVNVSEQEKFPTLVDEIKGRKGSVIVFTNTKHGADRMATRLTKEGITADALHGDLRQHKRTRVIANFRSKHYQVLVATDVAARGLDIPHIEHVINYDLPTNPEDYIHRIGRTARAGAEGEAVSFLSNADRNKWRAIERLLDPSKKQDDPVDPQQRRRSFKSKGPRRSGGEGQRRSAGEGQRRNAEGQNRDGDNRRRTDGRKRFENNGATEGKRGFENRKRSDDYRGGEGQSRDGDNRRRTDGRKRFENNGATEGKRGFENKKRSDDYRGGEGQSRDGDNRRRTDGRKRFENKGATEGKRGFENRKRSDDNRSADGKGNVRPFKSRGQKNRPHRKGNSNSPRKAA